MASEIWSPQPAPAFTCFRAMAWADSQRPQRLGLSAARVWRPLISTMMGRRISRLALLTASRFVWEMEREAFQRGSVIRTRAVVGSWPLPSVTLTEIASSMWSWAQIRPGGYLSSKETEAVPSLLLATISQAKTSATLRWATSTVTAIWILFRANQF